MCLALRRVQRRPLAWSPWIAARLLPLLLALLAAVPLALHAQPAPAEIDTTLDNARKQLDGVQKALSRDQTDAQLLQLRGLVTAIQKQSEDIATQLDPQLAGVEARQTELGKQTPDQTEAPDIAAQRAQLDKSHTALDAQIKLARLLSVEAQQAGDQISGRRRAEFQAQLGERTDSIISKPFWDELRASIARDAGRLTAARDEVVGALRAAPGWAWAAVLLASAALVVLRVWVGGALVRLVVARVPPGRLRRSASAAALAAIGLVVPGLIAWMVVDLLLRWNGPLSNGLDPLLDRVIRIACFGGYVSGLGAALLSAKRPSWRLPPLPDSIALGMRWFPRTLSLVIVAGWVAERLPELVNASLASTVAVQCLSALALSITLGLAVVRSERLRRRAIVRGEEGAGSLRRPPWLQLVAGLSWALQALSLVSLVVGFVAFGAFVVKQIAWISIVLATAYLFALLIDDLCTGFIATPVGDAKADDAAHGDKAHGAPALSPSLRDQIAVLLSGLGRVMVGLFALVLIVSRFGEGPSELLQRTGNLSGGVSLGEVAIRPAAVLQAVLVLVLALVALRWVKRWLTERYLPTTSLDPGMQLSAATLFGYAGTVTAVALAMSAVGIGLERVAWVASALSVGIGFGLQAVVQNFVSGLILLAERPVKVGDWVSLGGVEGDIRRINVRATEIQMGDRSTVIVPNSEFITKTVRNVTHANPLGLVQVKLPMPLDTDTQKVRELMQGAFDAHPDVLAAPAPSVSLDGIEGGQLVFNATGFASSPRATYGVRSALLFDILQRLRDAKLPMSKAPTMVLRDVPVQAEPLLPPSAATPPPG